ncbi:MAG: AAA family ATPase [Armatimonadota bacterium]
MYQSVRIQNFRGFENLTVDGLSRVNLIVGENGVGKTALLEAVYLLAGLKLYHPLRSLEARRGLSETNKAWRLDGDLLESLFCEFNARRPLQVNGTGARGDDAFTLSATNAQGQLGAKLSWRLADGRGLESDYGPDGPIGGTSSDPRALPSDEPVFLSTRTTLGLKAEANRFSSVVKHGKRPQIIRSLQVIEPRIRGLELLTFGEQSAVHADVGLLRMIPLGLIGEGLQRLCSLVLATSEASGFVLLVDEIDTGLHYSILADMWRVMSTAARELNYQLFTTTHSYECMTAAHEAFADHPEDFSMHRLERQKDGTIVSNDFGHDDLGTALELGFEVR